MRRVAIVGGGISGLSAAYFLLKAGIPATLIERRPRLGGVVSTERVDGCVVEAGPDSFISQKPWAMELIRELGLADEVIGSNDHQRKTYVLRRGRLIPLPDGVQFMVPTRAMPIVATPLFGLRAKCKMGLEWFRRGGREMPDRSVADFVIDHFGEEVNEYLAQPMLAGVYGGSPERLSVNSVLPRFVEFEKQHGSVIRGMLGAMRNSSAAEGKSGGGKRLSLFLSMRGGMSQLTAELEQRLRGKIEIITAEVRSAAAVEGGFRLTLDGDTLDAERLVAATPAWAAADLLGDVDAGLCRSLTGVGYNSSVTAALLYEREGFGHPLNGFGMLIPRAENRRLTACTWVNTKFPHRAPPDRVLLRGFLAGEQAEKALSLDDEAIAAQVHEELSALMGFSARPIHSRVHRWPRAMAQYEVGHERRLVEITERAKAIPGLYLAGNGYIGIGIPDCIRRARQVAERITQDEASR